jgi:hypothetical protein
VNIIHAARTKSGEQEGLGEEEESRDKHRAKQDDNWAVDVHEARIPVRFIRSVAFKILSHVLIPQRT